MQKPHRSHGWRLVDRCPNTGGRASSACGLRSARRKARPVELPLFRAPDLSRTEPSRDEFVSLPSECAPAPRMPLGRLGVAPMLDYRAGRLAGVHEAAPTSLQADRLPGWRPLPRESRLDGEEIHLGADADEVMSVLPSPAARKRDAAIATSTVQPDERAPAVRTMSVPQRSIGPDGRNGTP